MIYGDCDGCFYAAVVISDDAQPMVKCKRFPPVVVVVADEPVQMFPDAGNRCGEYRSVPDLDEIEKIRKAGIIRASDVLWPMCVCGHSQHVHSRDDKRGTCLFQDDKGEFCPCDAFAYRIYNKED